MHWQNLMQTLFACLILCSLASIVRAWQILRMPCCVVKGCVWVSTSIESSAIIVDWVIFTIYIWRNEKCELTVLEYLFSKFTELTYSLLLQLFVSKHQIKGFLCILHSILVNHIHKGFRCIKSFQKLLDHIYSLTNFFFKKTIKTIKKP